MDGLPDELLEDILRRLSPRDLAVCRSVHRDWRAAVDTHGLLLVSHVRGVFVNYIHRRRPAGFFSRRVAPAQGSPSVDGTLRFLPGWQRRLLARFRGVLDHRNGLLLYEDTLEMYVCNPATRRWATVPPPRVPPICHRLPFYRRRLHLLFDPTVSLHYDVLFLPDAPEKPKPPDHVGAGGGDSDYQRDYNATGSMEWPPSSYQAQVFSSRTGQWEDKNFVREEGSATFTVLDVWSDPTPPTSGIESIRRHGVYWRGALYVHCCGDFVMRLSLLEQKYRVIKTPRLHVAQNDEEYKYTSRTSGYLGKSNNGVYYNAIKGYQIQAWILRESHNGRPEWEVKHQANLKPTFVRHYNRHNIGTNAAESWILNPPDKVSEEGEDRAWDSGDDESVASDREEQESLEGYKKHYHYYGIDFLGYHPYKEIAFLGNSFNGFAYHLDSSKLQYLGSLFPQFSLSSIPSWAPVFESFIYTPCMKDLLPAHHDM
ncbi:unnamed protein product [Alopecurus aequalis]